MDNFEVALISNNQKKLLETNEVLMNMGVIPYLFLLHSVKDDTTETQPNIIEIDDINYINDYFIRDSGKKIFFLDCLAS